MAIGAKGGAIQLRSRRTSGGGSGGGNLLPLFFGFGVLLGALLMASILLGLRLAMLDNTTGDDAAVKLTHQINGDNKGAGEGGREEGAGGVLPSSGKPRPEELEVAAGNSKRDNTVNQHRGEQLLPRRVPERVEESNPNVPRAQGKATVETEPVMSKYRHIGVHRSVWENFKESEQDDLDLIDAEMANEMISSGAKRDRGIKSALNVDEDSLDIKLFDIPEVFTLENGTAVPVTPLEMTRIKGDIDDFDLFLETFVRKNIPVIFEGAVALSSIQQLNTSFLPNTRTLQGHTVVMVPLEHYEEYKGKMILPLKQHKIKATFDALWGGRKGTGAGFHCDKVCGLIHATQISGRKQWAIYYENELVRAVSDFEHGANYRSNLVYYGATEPGDVLVFYPWAAHAAKVLEWDSWSLNGQLVDESPKRMLNHALELPPMCLRH